MGGGFMIVVDDIARTLMHAEIPLGIITALFGAPLFAFYSSAPAAGRHHETCRIACKYAYLWVSRAAI